MNAQCLKNTNLKIGNRFISVILILTTLFSFVVFSIQSNAVIATSVLIGGTLIAFLGACGVSYALSGISGENLAGQLYNKFVNWIDTTDQNIETTTVLAGLEIKNNYLKISNSISERFSDFAEWLMPSIQDNSLNQNIYDIGLNISCLTMAKTDLQNYLVQNWDLLPKASEATILDVNPTTVNFSGTSYTFNQIRVTLGCILYNNGTQVLNLNSYSSWNWYANGLQKGFVFWISPANNTLYAICHYLTSDREFYVTPLWNVTSNDMSTSTISCTTPSYPSTTILDNEDTYLSPVGESTTIDDYITNVIDYVEADTLETSYSNSSSEPSQTSPSIPTNAFDSIWKYVTHLITEASDYFTAISSFLSAIPQKISWCFYGAIVLLLFTGLISKLLL